MNAKPLFPLMALLMAATSATISAAERVALVIGNNIYDKGKPAGAPPNLTNATSDAVAVQALLVEKLGFAAEDVMLGKDLGKVATLKLLEQFRAKAAGAKVAMIYYAGHGMESLDGVTNFMIPVDAEPAALENSDAALRGAGVDVGEELRLLGLMAPGVTKLIMLDCCRNRPGGRNTSGVSGGGLTQFKNDDAIPPATLIMLAAAPGRLASDGKKHGPFTEAFLEAMPVRGRTMLDSCFKLSDRVKELTKGQQVVWMKWEGSAEEFRKTTLTVRPEDEADPPPPPPHQPGDRMDVKLRDGRGLGFRYCPAGRFVMGSPPEEPGRDAGEEDQVAVELTKPFWMGETECPRDVWISLMGKDPSPYHADHEDWPVTDVSWNEVQKFVSKLQTTVELPKGWRLTLPTEAQWEYACRAGSTTAFEFGPDLTRKERSKANVYWGKSEDSIGHPEKVLSYPANSWGIHHMHGNVWEWCQDWFAPAYQGGKDPQGPVAPGEKRVFRGGSWNYPSRYVRAANRGANSPDYSGFAVGFRLAIVPAE